MPSSQVSNNAFNEATTGVLQILARALQWTEGPAGHLEMATEMATIMTLAFQSHAWSATAIPLILLSAAMELMEHVDHVGQTSFLTVLVWKNIKCDDPRIEHHHLYGMAHKGLTAWIPAPISQPPDTPPVTNPPAVPSLAAKSKPPGSDKIKIVGDITKSDPFQKRKRRSTGASEEVAIGHEEKVITPASVDKDIAEIVALGPTNTTPTRPKPKPKNKQVEIVVSSGSDVPMDRKGKGKEATLLVETDWRDYERRKSRAPWYEIQKRVSTRTATRDWQTSGAMFMEHKASAAPEPVAMMNMVVEADVNANTPITVIPLTPAPCLKDSPPSSARDMVIDLSSDTVVRDLQAMTLEVVGDLVSPFMVVQDTINHLQAQVADIRSQNTKMAELVQTMNARLGAQDTDIHTMEKMCAEITILQEEVKALHAESQTRETQIWNADAMLTAQGNCTAVLMDAYESIHQCVVPNLPVPPHFNNAVFFPAAGHTAPYSQGMSAGQAQAMEWLYFNFTPGPSMIASNSILNIAATHAGPSGSQTNPPSSELASRKVPA
ncbi:uncharacterized protein F5891DRAFT_1182680 [Suillus fuscotomentosus]|uniref:Uncharacterized protein n=1 Tax=Suillus fuscotomentosus TaxID=1912939 RepID=A0AAD4EGF9_9AGAM|nr:uncharacterized protein F5891DRAFT_1182680 [Suillus fuscotomentosus]KAG1905616.1 hypothetical protein F5891DRAFT_1182680 [Suillus fuscotomentosus]